MDHSFAEWIGLPMLSPIFSEDLKADLGAEWRAEDAEKETK